MNNYLLENDLEEVRDSFKINNLEGATWAFRKLRAIEAKVTELKEVAQEEINRINEWLSKEVKSLEDDKAYFEGLLTAYYMNEKANDKKFKLSTPYGKVSCRKVKKWSYDEEAVKEYLKSENLPFLKVKEEVDKAELKKAFKDGLNTESGEYIPGIVIEEVESISIKVEGGI